ncbi:MAG: glucose-1-phosphate adenylyltransferase [Psychrilyobacter sp.]|uniref:glucose-1-phosphate adenylyltransferase n=1 Tax=Psychrilyobacter sp. TaxID=2586924 RepID=UPI003C74F509
MRKKEMIAMLLAGGQGSRLVPLTSDVAKPAVDFGGKYKIIDFPLSNCTNSGIDTVGILTQYRPFLLNTHIGTGSAWDLNSMHGGTAILPPYTTQDGGAWYKGTANAIYQNIQYIDRYDPDHVLILSGDHIYKMDYNKMLREHKKDGADVTIAALTVTLEEAKRFGIMNVKDDNTIYEFEEKPEKPKSNLASMGIYIFKWSELKKYLIEDEKNKKSENDFGMNILPKMLGDGLKMITHPFKGYWKDVGTINSLWEANMDLLDENNDLNLHTNDWKIYTSGEPKGAAYFGERASVKNSMVVDGCEVNGSIKNTVLFPGVIVEEGAIVENSVLFPNVKIGKGVILDRVIVGENTNVMSGTHVGDATIKVIPQNKTIK